MDKYSHDGKNKYSHDINLYKLTLRHGEITMKQDTYEMSDIGNFVNQVKYTSECNDCAFGMSFVNEIIDYCLNECPAGRRNMEVLDHG